MFDMIFGAMQAWHVLGLFIMGAVFILVGGGLISWGLYWRLAAKRTNGIISAVRVAHKKEGNMKGFMGEMYHSVLSFSLPNGERVEHVSNSASNSLLGKLPGRKVSILYFPGRPDKIRRPSLIPFIFGSVFFLPGVYILMQAIKSFEVNGSFFMVFALILAFIAYKISGPILEIRKNISQMPEEEWGKAKKKFKESGFSVRSSSASKNAVLLDTQEIITRLKAQYKSVRIMVLVCLLGGLGLLGGSIYVGQDMMAFLNNAHSVQGEVVSIESEYNTSSEGNGYTYYSIVKFLTLENQSVRFKDSVGSSHAMHKTGEVVDVLFSPDSPDDAIIDRGVFNWGMTGGLFLASLFFLWGLLHNLKAMRVISRF